MATRPPRKSPLLLDCCARSGQPLNLSEHLPNGPDGKFHCGPALPGLCSNTEEWGTCRILPVPHFTPRPRGRGWRLCPARGGAKLKIHHPCPVRNSQDQRHKQIFTGDCPFPQQRAVSVASQAQIGSTEALSLWSAAAKLLQSCQTPQFV